MYIPSSASSSSARTPSAQNFVYNPATSNTGISARRRTRWCSGATSSGTQSRIRARRSAPDKRRLLHPRCPRARHCPSIGPQYTGAWLIAWDVVTQKEKWRAKAAAVSAAEP